MPLLRPTPLIISYIILTVLLGGLLAYPLYLLNVTLALDFPYAKVLTRSVILAAVLLLAVIGGCGPPVYRVRTTVPWPDEWKAGPRRPDRIDLPMSLETMAWHRGTDSRILRRRVQRIIAAFPDAMILSRTGFADLQGRARNPDSAFAFMEVRVTACPIPVSSETRRFKWNINEVSLEKVLERFSIGIGQKIRLADNVDGSMPVTFHADELGAAEALACILLRNNLYLTPTCLGTSVLRSYEYANRDLFLRASRISISRVR